jgi:Flp pilus assembly protein TadD
VLGALVVAGAGAVGARLAAGGDALSPRTVVRTRVVTSQGRTTVRVVTASEAARSPQQGHQLNDRGYALMRAGDYAAALPLLRSAVSELRGSGPDDPYEGYANYNLGYTLIALDRCRAALPPLRRADHLEDAGEVRWAIELAQVCSQADAAAEG